MTRGKSKNRIARIDMLQSREANARRNARQQTRTRYNRRTFDKPICEES